MKAQCSIHEFNIAVKDAAHADAVDHLRREFRAYQEEVEPRLNKTTTERFKDAFQRAIGSASAEGDFGKVAKLSSLAESVMQTIKA